MEFKLLPKCWDEGVGAARGESHTRNAAMEPSFEEGGDALLEETN